MSSLPTVKILVGYHKPATLVKSDVFVPIHLGRAVATDISKDGQMSSDDYQWLLDNMIGDDTGDNISELNRYLCEMTGLYWAWKNDDKLGNPDYVGFMHYRRHLSFNVRKKLKEDMYGLLYTKQINARYLKKFHLQDKKIQKLVSQYDVVVAKKTDLNRLGTGTPYNHYKDADPKMHIKDYDCALEVLNEKYPDYIVDASDYNRSSYAYFTNVFVMKRELYPDYCQFMFSILNETRKRIDVRGYTPQEMRALAYISEWLSGIYITHLYRQRKQILELQRIHVQSTSLLSQKQKRATLSPQMRQDVDCLSKIKRQYWLCRALSKMSIGQKRQQYQQQCNTLKNKIKQLKDCLRAVE